MSTLGLLREQIAANRRAYQLTVAIVVAGLALFGLLVTLVFGLGVSGLGAGLGLAVFGLLVTLVLGLGVSGLGAGLGLAVLVVGFAPGMGERAALRDAGAQAADPGRWPRYHNLVEGLSQAADHDGHRDLVGAPVGGDLLPQEVQGAQGRRTMPTQVPKTTEATSRARGVRAP